MPTPSEFDIQRAFCLWLDGFPDPVTKRPTKPPALFPGVVYWHTPNGGSRSSAFEGKRLKQIGTKAGIPDLLFLKDGGLYGLEFKAAGEHARTDQIAMHILLISAGAAAIATVDSLAAARVWAFRFGLSNC